MLLRSLDVSSFFFPYLSPERPLLKQSLECWDWGYPLKTLHYYVSDQPFGAFLSEIIFFKRVHLTSLILRRSLTHFLTWTTPV